MAFTMKVRRPDGKTVDLTPSQFVIAEPIIVRMMNGELKPAAAQQQILDLLAEQGMPVDFSAT